MVTAGVFRVSFAVTTAPLSSTNREGDRCAPEDVTTASSSDTGSGSNQPTVRLDARSIVRAASATWSSVTPSMRSAAERKRSMLAMVVEVAQLMRDIRHAVVVEHQTGLQLALGALAARRR